MSPPAKHAVVLRGVRDTALRFVGYFVGSGVWIVSSAVLAAFDASVVVGNAFGERVRAPWRRVRRPAQRRARASASADSVCRPCQLRRRGDARRGAADEARLRDLQRDELAAQRELALSAALRGVSSARKSVWVGGSAPVRAVTSKRCRAPAAPRVPVAPQ